jgi:hypothetical protein
LQDKTKELGRNLPSDETYSLLPWVIPVNARSLPGIAIKEAPEVTVYILDGE